MTATLAVTLGGIVLIAVFGFLGRRGRSTDLAQWTVGGRRLGLASTWFLQAGEVFTTFTFLGLAGLAKASGAPAFYALGYIPLQYLILYFVAPRIRRIGRARGYLTQADFLAGQYDSPALGLVAAVFGVVFLLPYLQVQITGLGLIVNLATGDAASGTLSMVVATVLVIGFVLWGGIRGVAMTSYLKDVLMIVMLAVAAVAVTGHFTGGLADVYTSVARRMPETLGLRGGEYDRVWFLTNLAVSLIGAGCAAFPYVWPGILGARSDRVLRRNYVFQPLYAVCVLVPITLGFTAMLVLPAGADADGSLLTLATRAMPGWAVGLLAVAGIATAMVPAAALLVSMSSIVARNVVRARSERAQFWVTQAVVVVAALVALLLAVGRPDALADLALLTFSGLTQLVPAVVLALRDDGPRVSGRAVLAGLIAGMATVIYLTFAGPDVANVNAGIIGLVVNALVVAVVAAGRRPVPDPVPAREPVPERR